MEAGRSARARIATSFHRRIARRQQAQRVGSFGPAKLAAMQVLDEAKHERAVPIIVEVHAHAARDRRPAGHARRRRAPYRTSKRSAASGRTLIGWSWPCCSTELANSWRLAWSSSWRTTRSVAGSTICSSGSCTTACGLAVVTAASGGTGTLEQVAISRTSAAGGAHFSRQDAFREAHCGAMVALVKHTFRMFHVQAERR
jgi:hypothetical protein